MLISILVLSVGLLGTLSLVPLGHHDIVEAAKMERGSNLGRLAFRDIIIRGYLRPDMWCDQNGNSTMMWQNSMNESTPPDAFVIDPLLYGQAASSGDSPPSQLPYTTKTYGGPPAGAVIPRISIRAAYNSSSGPGNWASMNLAAADRVCRLNDDLAFVQSSDAKAPPAMSYLYDSNQKRMTRQFEGNYCWLVTLAPAVTEMATDAASGFVSPPTVNWSPPPNPAPPANWQSTWTTRQYAVSIAICYKRDLSDYGMQINSAGTLTPPAERWAVAQMTSGLGGGEVQLQSNFPAWLEKLKPNQWIMLSAKVPYTDANGNPATRTWLDWYRITAVDDGADLTASPATRWVTLHGADWLLPTSGSGAPQVYATIIDGIVGVYQKTITLDGTSAWAK